MRDFVAESAAAGMRTDVFVVSKYPDFTRSALNALFEQKLVKVNDSPAKPAQKLKVGDVVSVDESLLKLEPPKIDLPVIYEDDDVIVIDKPAGVLSHAKGALNLEGTVASFIKSKLNDPELAGNRAGIVHRLDRDTSGLMIAAKNQSAMKFLQKQFSTRKVHKVYTAIVEGVPESTEAIIDAPILRNPAKLQTFKVDLRGKQAITKYKVFKVFNKNNNQQVLLELEPQTGRTHQLRVHLKYIGHPVVGDRIYGQAGQRMMLHASALELTIPAGERKHFTSPLPKNFKYEN